MLEVFTSRNDDIFFLPLVRNQKKKKELLSTALWAQKVAMYFHTQETGEYSWTDYKKKGGWSSGLKTQKTSPSNSNRITVWTNGLQEVSIDVPKHSALCTDTYWGVDGY